MNTIVRTSDGISLVAGYHFSEIKKAVSEGKDKVWFNSNDLVEIKDKFIDEFGNLTIRVGSMQEIILKD